MLFGIKTHTGKKKIIISNTSVYAGGAESVFRTLTNYLAFKGYDVTVAIIYYPKSGNLETAFAPEVKCIRSRLPKKNTNNQVINKITRIHRVLYRLLVLAYMNAQHYDISIAFKEGLSTVDTLHIKSEKKIAWIHSDLRLYNDMASFYTISEEHDVYQKYDKVICVSETAKAGFVDVLGDTKNLFVKYNPMNWREIRQKAEVKCPVLRDTRIPLIVTVGTLEKGKNYGILLEAVKLLQGRVAFEVWMLGKDGPEADGLRQYVYMNGLDNVHFWGFQKKNYFPHKLKLKNI